MTCVLLCRHIHMWKTSSFWIQMGLKESLARAVLAMNRCVIQERHLNIKKESTSGI